MLSGKLLCLLLALQLCSTNTSAVDVTVSVGDTAFLPCPSLFNSNVTKISFQWSKDGGSKFCTYFIENNKINVTECGSRVKVNTDPSGLNITGVESSDAGLYTCVMDKIIPPPAERNSSNVTLKVNAVPPSLSLQLMNSTNFSCVELLCSLQGLRPQQVNFTWTRGDQTLHHHETSSMSSTLTLCRPNWTDGDTLTCHAIYSHNHTVDSKNITLPSNSADPERRRTLWVVISTCAGGLLLILLGVAICIYKKRGASSESVTYRNKIYENFTFSASTINSTPRAQYAQSVVGSNIRSTTTSIPQTIRQTQREECIYEN